MKIRYYMMWAVALVALLGLAGCSGRDAAQVVDVIPGGYVSLLFNGDKVAASAGVSTADDLDGFNAWRGNVPFELLMLDGIERSQIAAMMEKPGSTVLWVAAVTDASALEKSLGKNGYKKDGDGMYASAAGRGLFKVDEDYLWGAVGNAGKLARMVEAVRSDVAAKPLAQWQRDALLTDVAMTVVYNYENINGVFEVKLDGSKLAGSMRLCEADGRPKDIATMLGLSKLDSDVASQLDADATLSLAVGKGDYSMLLRALASFYALPLPLSSSDISSISYIVKGPIAGFITLDDNDFTNLEALKCNLMVKTAGGAMARLVLGQIVGELPSQVSSTPAGDKYMLSLFSDSPVAEIGTDGDWLYAHTLNVTGGRKLSGVDVAESYAMLNFNLTKPMVAMASGVDDVFGIKGAVRLEGDGLSFDVELTGTAEPFLAAIIDAYERR